MNQNDFRALLQAKTSGSSNDASGKSSAGGSFGGKRNMTASDLEEIRRLSKKPKKKGKKPGKSTASGDNDDSSSSNATATKSAYRDRAAERRQGIHSDMIDADEFAHLDAEQTKFLGGDLEHTHLVKGLDFALLSQLKREKEKLQHATAAHKQQQQVQSTSGSLSSTATASDKLTFKSRVGRLVYFHAVQSSAVSSALASRATEQFLPGRMFYTFRLTGDDDVASVPVIVQRSKEDCPEPDDVVSGMVSELVISKVGDALHRTRHGGDGSKKLRKKTKASSAGSDLAGRRTGEGVDDDSAASNSAAIAAAAAPRAPPAIDSDDEDIFPDAGEYVPIHARDDDSAQTTSQTHEAPSRSKQTGYFSNLSASLSAAEQAEKEREEAAEHAWKQTIRKVVATQTRAEREQQAREAQRTTAPVDEYAECYPEYQAAASAIDSEDDEEAPRKGADRDKGDGGDVDETEKTRRRKQKQGNKLQNDLEKINKVCGRVVVVVVYGCGVLTLVVFVTPAHGREEEERVTIEPV